MKNKQGFAPIIIICIVAVALVVGGGAWYYSYHFPLVVGAEFTFQGTVLENVTIEHQSDGPAYFFVLTDKGAKIKVVYVPGMYCLNYEATAIGFSTKAGDKVEVRGKAISKNELFTCESKEYYIKILDSRSNSVTTMTAEDGVDKEFGSPVLKIVWSGGLCPSRSACTFEFLLKNDGSYTFDGHAGKISEEKKTKLDSLIASADFVAMKSKKLIGTCARSYDGSSPTYTFYLEAREEIIDSCNVEIDASSPLFSEIDKITESLLRRP